MATPGTQDFGYKYYGNPGPTGSAQEQIYRKNNIVSIEIVPGRFIAVHKKAKRHFLRLGNILENKAPRYAKTIDNFMDDWGFANRNIGGTSVKSNHAFGIAVDIDATRNAQGKNEFDCPIWKEAKQAVLQAEKEGLCWGGRYSNPDAMHFETLLRPAQIKARYNRHGKPRAWYKAKIR